MSRPFKITVLTTSLFAMTLVLIPLTLAKEPSLASASSLLNTGKYAEATAAFDQLAPTNAVAAAIGKSRCLAARGEYDQATETLSVAQQKSPQAPELQSELAQIQFLRGNYPAAKRHVDRALELDKNQVTARLLVAELARVSGELDTAQDAYRFLVDYYNSHELEWTAEQLHMISLAAAQHARWNRLSDQFSFLVNDLYPEILKRDPTYWQAHLESARLFLEKYNEPDANRELQAALRINPNAAEVHVALARLALQSYQLDQALRHIRRAENINPRLLSAQLALADVHLANCEPQQAAEVLEKARALNPRSEKLLGRLAAAWALIDGLQQSNSKLDGSHSDKANQAEESSVTRLDQLTAQVTKENSHPGQFYLSLAESLDLSRRYPDAAIYYARAIEVMPQQIGPRGQLGLIHMRLGEETTARRVLDEAFRIDPFNVRVSNSLKVLGVLEDYETLETEHFLVRFDGTKDRVLAHCAAEHLESIYPELCQRLGFSLPEKALFEIFHDAEGTSGHSWFSARMIGLPNIHTIGACAGKVVAMTSPTSMRSKVNWARVMRHELVHVINLQQTHFNIPHWFTEALAVHCEDQPRPREWNVMLARRVPKGEVFDLSSVNMAFIRPNTSEDWLMAYCQADIYADYMISAHGPDSLAKMLVAYRNNLSTPEAIQKSFNVSIEEFENGYDTYLKKIVADLPRGIAAKAPNFAELQTSHAEQPDDLETASRLAHALLRRGKTTEAGELVDQILKTQPKHQLATYVRAKLLLSIGQSSAARELLEACLDRDSPQKEVLKLLGSLCFKADELDQAGEIFQIGATHYPGDPAWTKSLALVYLQQKDEPALAKSLQALAAASDEDVVVRRKLAKMAADREDHAAAARWANQVIQIDVLDAQMHTLRATSLSKLGKQGEAAKAYKLATMLRPQNRDLLLALAVCHQKSGNRIRAERAAHKLLVLAPDEASPHNAAAKKLLESLKP